MPNTTTHQPFASYHLPSNWETTLQAIYFTLVAVLLYFFSDWLLLNIERRRGKPFANRHVIFFVIIMTLSLIGFEVLQAVLQSTSQT